MYCTRCGQVNSDEARFCHACGKDLSSQTPPGGAPDGHDMSGDSTLVQGGMSLTRMRRPELTPAESDLSGLETIVPGLVHAQKLLAGQYRILDDRPLGSGGMGEVWRAEDTELDNAIVAIKVLPAVLARNAQAVTSLKREALIGRQLAHPNICRLYSFHSDGDVKFIVMEYVTGKTLAEMLAERDGHKLSWEEMQPLAVQLAEALDYAHNLSYAGASGRQVKGILHRDIKPQNIMVTAEGAAKLMDFGIAREIHNTMTEVTGRTSQTPLYASPEQFRGDRMTAASDLYSFTAVLYECLAGRRLVSAHGDISYQVLHKEFEPLDSHPASVNKMLAAGLAKDPKSRPSSAAALILSVRRKDAGNDEMLAKVCGLSKTFYSKNLQGRRKAAKAIAELATQIGIHSILELCESVDRGERVAGFVALRARIQSPTWKGAEPEVIVAVLRKGLTDSESRVRYRVLEAIEASPTLRSRFARELQQAAREEPNDMNRELVVSIVESDASGGSIPPSTIPHSGDDVKETEEYTALAALAELQDTELRDGLDQLDSGPRKELAEGLSMIQKNHDRGGL